jgi:hypothetical protein
MGSDRDWEDEQQLGNSRGRILEFRIYLIQVCSPLRSSSLFYFLLRALATKRLHGLRPLRPRDTYVGLLSTRALAWPTGAFSLTCFINQRNHQCSSTNTPSSKRTCMYQSKCIWKVLLELFELLPCCEGLGHARPLHQDLSHRIVSRDFSVLKQLSQYLKGYQLIRNFFCYLYS